MIFQWDDPSRITTDTSALHLSAISGVEEFSFCVTKDTGEPIMARAYAGGKRRHFFDRPLASLNAIITANEVLFEPFVAVRIAVRGVPFVCVGADLAKSPEQRHHVLSQATTIAARDAVRYDIIHVHNNISLAVVYAVPDAFIQECRIWYGNAAIAHVMTALVRCASDRSKQMPGPLFLVDISASWHEIVVCRDGDLLFANHFRAGTHNDLLYYLLAIAADLKIEAGDAKVRCIGARHPERAAAALKDYLPDTEVLIAQASEGRNPGLVDLISVARCAS